MNKHECPKCSSQLEYPWKTGLCSICAKKFTERDLIRGEVERVSKERDDLQSELDAKRQDGCCIVEHGYRISSEHEAKRLTAQVTQLRGALEKLANESEGFVSMASVENHGITNIKCLKYRIDQARDALASGEKENG